jgi:hypothetical protein
MLSSPKEIVIVTPIARSEAAPFLERLGRVFVPNRVLSVVVEGADQEAHAELVAIVREKTAQKGARPRTCASTRLAIYLPPIPTSSSARSRGFDLSPEVVLAFRAKGAEARPGGPRQASKRRAFRSSSRLATLDRPSDEGAE